MKYLMIPLFPFQMSVWGAKASVKRIHRNASSFGVNVTILSTTAACRSGLKRTTSVRCANRSGPSSGWADKSQVIETSRQELEQEGDMPNRSVVCLSLIRIWRLQKFCVGTKTWTKRFQNLYFQFKRLWDRVNNKSLEIILINCFISLQTTSSRYLLGTYVHLSIK